MIKIHLGLYLGLNFKRLRLLTLYKNNSRYSSKFKGCSHFKIHVVNKFEARTRPLYLTKEPNSTAKGYLSLAAIPAKSNISHIEVIITTKKWHLPG